MIIERRYNGPPNSGNGGWTAGLIATEMGRSAEVTLRLPPPLDTPLTVTCTDQTLSVYAAGDALVATAHPAEVAAEPIGAVPYAEAEAVSATYPGFTANPFPTCFVCGPKRAPGDGLRLFTGRLTSGDTATPWTVPSDVSAPMVWAALDCPGGWSIDIEARPYVLGRVATHVDALPAPGDECVVMGRLLNIAGRKASVASVLYGPEGTALAWSRATWIALPTR
jgi:hypothetical protein